MVFDTGCASKGKYNSAIEERDALQEEYNSVLEERDALIAERDELAMVTAEQEAEISRLEAGYQELATLFAMEISRNEFQLRRLVDGIEVAIPSDVFYKSGETRPTVDDESIPWVEKLVNFLKSSDYFISVVGHTDNQQPTAALAEKYPTNWALAAARSANAVHYLASHGVDPTRMAATSRGEFDPIASNDTEEGRAENRRIQIILRRLPK